MPKLAMILGQLLGGVAVSSVLVRAENPNLQGFTKGGLDALNSEMHKWVDAKNGSNVVTILSRNGEIVNHDAYGVLDYTSATKQPAAKDTIFAIMSMSKPIVGVAMMMMYEDGKWKMDDLVSKHIPEFADLKVNKTTPQATPMTMAQLVSHSAGFHGNLTVRSPTLGTIIPPLVESQLAFQPGRDWRYGPGVEIQGYLIEKWAGKDLSDFLQERLFTPLGMVDTQFFVDKSKSQRVTRLHTKTGPSLLSLPPAFPTSKPKKIFPSGGLYSTAEDYWKFTQMVLNGGESKGKRILKPETITVMHTNVLASDVPVKFGGSDGKGIGFGVDFAIVLDKEASRNNQPKGAFYWGGAYGTWFWIDPVNNVTFVGLIQNLGAKLSGDESLRQISAKATYAALKP
jgi:CubicO group peptidase (beta-lactamase class C family)